MNEVIIQALLNTVMGMLVVFSVLILIAFLISLFQYIPIILDKFSKKTEEPVQVIEETVSVEAEPVSEEDLIDDQELVAVITAAIAASSSVSSVDQLIVRSIKRVSKRR